MKKNKNKINQFLKSLEKIPIVQKACEECGLSRNTIYRWRRENNDFRKKMDKSIKIGNRVIDDLAHMKYFSLMNEKHWPAIKHRLLHSPTTKELTELERHDRKMAELRGILNEWRDMTIEEKTKKEPPEK